MSNFFTPEFNNESAIAPWNASLEPTKAIIPQLDANRVLTGGVGEEVNLPTLTPEAYENIILPEDLLTRMASAVSTDSNSSLPDSSVDLLTGQAMSEVYGDLSKFAADPDFAAKLNVAFGENWDAAAAKALAEGWFQGDFSDIPSVKVVSSAEIGGANGAFAAATDTIYLSKEFLTQNVANPAAVADVLLEEIGHSVDARLNVTDSPGDEGAIFGAIVQGKELSHGELQGLKSKDDRATATIDGKVIEIEEQRLLGGSQGTILGVDGSSILLGGALTRNDSNNPTRDGKFADDYRFDNLSPGQQLQLDLNSDDFDSFLQLVDERTGRVITQDDDAGGNRNSRLSFTVQPNINYIVRATSYDPGETGNYTISSINLSNISPDPDGAPDKAKPLVLQGKSLSNGQNGGIIESENIGRNYNYGKDSADYYKFSLNEARRINIALDNLTADADLVLFREGDNTFREESGRSFTNPEAISRELQPGTYFVKVIPYETAQTDYKLRITELTGNIEEKGLWRGYDEENKFYNNGVNLYRFDKNGRQDNLGIESDKDTIVVIHGWTDSTETDSDGKESPIKSLGKAAAEKYTNYQVLALDWRDPARNSTSSDRKDKGRDSVFPYHGARSITPVATWAVNTLINLGINPNKLSIFGHSLGSHLGTEIGRIFNEDKKLGQLKNFVALDPAHDINDYDLDGNIPGDQKVKEKWDFAQRSLALVGKEGGVGVEGIAGSSEGAARAQDSLVVDLTDERINPGTYHIAPVKIFQKALEKNYLKLEENLALPNGLIRNSYDDNASVAHFRNGRHEGKIVAKSDGTIETLEYVNRTGFFGELKGDGRAWTS
ncbi:MULTISPECIES: pre-peptidase C-terminal domain-containing protein [unclassified Microcoleus]|uniref:pre-peptidase C-terminal domain-containing protein n=1 Tax=unclassified Microcoleus TaxID=2642155 RepID=UPI002FD5F943